jgi:hypothetical protein
MIAAHSSARSRKLGEKSIPKGTVQRRRFRRIFAM